MHLAAAALAVLGVFFFTDAVASSLERRPWQPCARRGVGALCLLALALLVWPGPASAAPPATTGRLQADLLLALLIGAVLLINAWEVIESAERRLRAQGEDLAARVVAVSSTAGLTIDTMAQKVEELRERVSGDPSPEALLLVTGEVVNTAGRGSPADVRGEMARAATAAAASLRQVRAQLQELSALEDGLVQATHVEQQVLRLSTSHEQALRTALGGGADAAARAAWVRVFSLFGVVRNSAGPSVWERIHRAARGGATTMVDDALCKRLDLEGVPSGDEERAEPKVAGFQDGTRQDA